MWVVGHIVSHWPDVLAPDLRALRNRLRPYAAQFVVPALGSRIALPTDPSKGTSPFCTRPQIGASSNTWASTLPEAGMNPITRGPGFGRADRWARSSDPRRHVPPKISKDIGLGYFFECPLRLLYVRWSKR